MMRYQSMDETLIMSDELEERLGYLRDDPDRATVAKAGHPTILVSNLGISFRILGWDTQKKNVTIAVSEFYLHNFLFDRTSIRGTMFDHDFAVTDTVAIYEEDAWKITLSLVDL
jgi:hypothetical protein